MKNKNYFIKIICNNCTGHTEHYFKIKDITSFSNVGYKNNSYYITINNIDLYFEDVIEDAERVFILLMNSMEIT